MQVDDKTAPSQIPAVIGVDDGAAACGKDDMVATREFLDDLALARTETGLTLEFEDGGDGHAIARLDLVVAVDESQPEFAREQAAHRRFTGAHETDEEDSRDSGHGRILNEAPGASRVTARTRSV